VIRHFRNSVLLALLLLAPMLPAAAAQESLPGGATSLRENHGDWLVVCAVRTDGGKSVKSCQLVQEQFDGNTRRRVLAMELTPGQPAAQGLLVLPFGLALDQGAALQIDDQAPAPASRFRTCLPGGCIVNVSFDAKMLAALRAGTALKIRANADGGKEMSFQLSLNGFGSAYDRTVSLLK